MCVKIFINSHSGGVTAVGVEKVSSLIFHELKAAGLDCKITSAGAADFQEFAESCRADENVTMAVVAGGDGTMAMAAGAFVNTNISVALLPGGTMNLISHDLGIGGDLVKAIGMITDCRPRFIDVAYANGRPFLNNVVFGDYADVAEAREQVRDASNLQERLGAISEATQTLLNSASEKFVVRHGETVRSIDSNILMVANNRYTTAIDMRPRRRRIDSGKLAIYLADSKDGIDMIARMIEVVRGELGDAESIDCVEASDCSVTNGKDVDTIAIDGEPVEVEFPVQFRIQPRSLSVLCPDE